MVVAGKITSIASIASVVSKISCHLRSQIEEKKSHLGVLPGPEKRDHRIAGA
jgi:hypothetical protein